MSSSEFNPYASPSDLVMQPDAAARYFRDGKFLIVRDAAELPHVCLLTNEPAGERAWRKRVTIYWTPPWVFITILLNILVLLIVMLVFRKKAKITYSLNSRARSKIVRRKVLGSVLLAAAFGLFLAGAFSSGHEDVPLLIIGGVLTLIFSLIVFIVANPVKVVRFRDGWFRVRGCSREFLDTLPVYPSPF